MRQAIDGKSWLWIAIALVLHVKLAPAYENQHFARSAFAEEIAAMKSEFGPDIDTSLDGYDHSLLSEEVEKRSGFERAPLHIRSDLDSQAADLLHEYGQDVDLSLDGYDHDLVARYTTGDSEDVEHVGSLERPDGEVGAEDMGSSGVGADIMNLLRRMDPHHLGQTPSTSSRDPGSETNYERSASAEDVKQSPTDGDGAQPDEGEEIDYSLEGYDHDLIARALSDDASGEQDPEASADTVSPSGGSISAAKAWSSIKSISRRIAIWLP